MNRDGINEIMYTGEREGAINIWDKKSVYLFIFFLQEQH